MIAGLEEITDGELYIDGKLMNKVKPNKRDITRTIVRKPKAFLMDEPLSNLDAKLRTANVFVAGFIGSPQINTIKGKLVYVKEHYYIRIEDQEIPLSQEQGEYLRSRQYMGQEILVGIRPEDVRLVSDKETYGFSTVVEAFEMLGAQTNLFLKHGDWEVRVQEEGNSSWKTKRLAKVVFPAEHLHFFDPYTECRI